MKMNNIPKNFNFICNIYLHWGFESPIKVGPTW